MAADGCSVLIAAMRENSLHPKFAHFRSEVTRSVKNFLTHSRNIQFHPPAIVKILASRKLTQIGA